MVASGRCWEYETERGAMYGRQHNNKRGFTTTDIDTILREYGLTPRWDYSKVGESVIVVRKNRELSPKDA